MVTGRLPPPASLVPLPLAGTVPVPVPARTGPLLLALRSGLLRLLRRASGKRCGYLGKRGDREAFIPRSVVILGEPDHKGGGVFFQALQRRVVSDFSFGS